MEKRNEPTSFNEWGSRNGHEELVNFSQIRRPPPSRPDRTKRVGSILTQSSNPSEHPSNSEADAGTQGSRHSTFHNYLRAFCAFDPPTDASDQEEALLMTAPIRPGDLILIHSVHPNGWADGTVLTSGARGWIPTNYCEAFDHPYLRNLLNAMTQFWDLLKIDEDANLSTFVRQDYIRGLIAGVRDLLERADCLHRDTAVVQRSTGLRRMRKGLLADLSSLVQIAKSLQETISEPFAGEVIHVLLDDLMAKAFRVVTRAVGFVDMLNQDAAPFKDVSVGHPLDSKDSAHKDGDGLANESSSSNRSLPELIHPTKLLHSTSYGSFESALTPSEGYRAQQSERKTKRRTGDADVQTSSVTHRLSLVRRGHLQVSNLASEQLATAHDICISHIGAFIGLHLHSRPSSEVIATTKRLAKACETMLAIVDQVASQQSIRSSAIDRARTSFQLRLDELTLSTRDVFKFSDAADDSMVMLPEQTTHLVNVGTSLIRSVGECVIETRRVIANAGDFELHQPGVDNSRVVEEQAASGASLTKREPHDAAAGLTLRPNVRALKKTTPPPPLRPSRSAAINVTDFAQRSPTSTIDARSPITPYSAISHSSMPLQLVREDLVLSPTSTSDNDALRSPKSLRMQFGSPSRKCSLGNSIAGSIDTRQGSMRDSGFTAVSEVSTRATTPDQTKGLDAPDTGNMSSFGSLSSLRSAANTDASGEAEAHLLQKTYANELILGKDGQVTGGTLASLVEQLTTGDIAPDPQFVAAFFVTFRAFTTSRELAQALIHRFEYIGDSKNIGTPVRLRIYNVFKGWLETYWNADADKDALGEIRYFAVHKLRPHLPPAGERLVELTRKVAAIYHTGNNCGPFVSAVGKTSMSIGVQYETESNVPESIITKSQLNALRHCATSDAICSVTELDPLELARQLTILASNIFCEIQPDELLSLDWNRKTTTRATNVRKMCTLNTDLAHVVGDTILTPDDAKKRAAVIKHWSKVAMRCLELNNYESLMAIVCSLNSSVVQRLKRTWEVVSKKTRARLEELNQIVDFSRNYASLRCRLEKPIAPCLPFLGIYLTDLTFVDAGNPKMRELPGDASDSGQTVCVINFDKHMRMAKTISHVQKFQVPYKLRTVPEMQAWLQTYLDKMREGNAQMVGNFHRRSMVLEPKRVFSNRPGLPEVRRHTDPNAVDERPKTAGSIKTAQSIKPHGQTFEFLLKTNFNFKARPDLPPLPDSLKQG